MNELTRTPTELEVITGPDARLLIRPWTNAAGRVLITVVPQIAAKDGSWRLAHSGLSMAPGAALELAAALTTMARTAVKP